MATQTTSEQGDRILVALDASPHSVAALQAAAELAALLEAELEGLFVEDINLLHLSGFPFGQEIGSYTATVRRLDSQALERQLRVLAVVIREAMERVAGKVPVRWTFQVRRGAVVAELLAASQTASMLSLGRTSRHARKTLGSTAQSIVTQTSRPVLILGEEGGLKYPLTVLYTGTEASERALHLALTLARRNHSTLRVLVWAGEDERADRLASRIEQALVGESVPMRVETVLSAARLLAMVRAGDGGTLLLPSERSFLVSEHEGPTILVP